MLLACVYNMYEGFFIALKVPFIRSFTVLWKVTERTLFIILKNYDPFGFRIGPVYMNFALLLHKIDNAKAIVESNKNLWILTVRILKFY